MQVLQFPVVEVVEGTNWAAAALHRGICRCAMLDRSVEGVPDELLVDVFVFEKDVGAQILDVLLAQNPQLLHGLWQIKHRLADVTEPQRHLKVIIFTLMTGGQLRATVVLMS